jgi:TolB-like protein
MIQKIHHDNLRSLVGIGVIALILLLSACKSDIIISETPVVKSGIEKLLILPFKDLSTLYGKNVNVRCPLCGNVFSTGDVETFAVDVLTDRLISIIKSRKDFELIPPNQAQGAMSVLMAADKSELLERDMFVKIGRALYADAILVGHVYRFKDRVGTRYSVDSPASVAFDIHLIDVSKGSMLWVGHFDETQRPLSENLFKIGTFLRRKGIWITAEEMAVSGLEDVLQTFPKL